MKQIKSRERTVFQDREKLACTHYTSERMYQFQSNPGEAEECEIESSKNRSIYYKDGSEVSKAEYDVACKDFDNHCLDYEIIVYRRRGEYLQKTDKLPPSNPLVKRKYEGLVVESKPEVPLFDTRKSFRDNVGRNFRNLHFKTYKSRGHYSRFLKFAQSKTDDKTALTFSLTFLTEQEWTFNVDNNIIRRFKRRCSYYVKTVRYTSQGKAPVLVHDDRFQFFLDQAGKFFDNVDVTDLVPLSKKNMYLVIGWCIYRSGENLEVNDKICYFHHTLG